MNPLSSLELNRKLTAGAIGGYWKEIASGSDADHWTGTEEVVVGDKLVQYQYFDVPWYLDWAPDVILDWLITNVVEASLEIENDINNYLGGDGRIEITDIDVNVVTPGERYDVVTYMTVKEASPLIGLVIAIGVVVVIVGIVGWFLLDKGGNLLKWFVEHAYPLLLILAAAAAIGAAASLVVAIRSK